MAKKSVQVGDLVAVTFLDHLHSTHNDHAELVTCEAYGKVVALDERRIIIRAWESQDCPDNNENFVIIRSAIEKMVRLHPSR